MLRSLRIHLYLTLFLACSFAWATKPLCDGPFLEAKDILQAATFLEAGGNPQMLSEKTLQALSQISKSSIAELNDPLILKKIRDTVNDSKLSTEVAGNQILAAKKLMEEKDSYFQDRITNDKTDALRGWGWELLPKNDIAFNNPEYLAKLIKQSNATASGMGTLNPNYVEGLFNDAIHKLAPKFNIDAYVQTGSDANNLFFDLANQVASRRMNKPVRDAEILFFDGAYGGVRGRVSGMNMMTGRGEIDAYRITSPHTSHWMPEDPMVIADIEAKETEALQQIEEKFNNSEKPIGGVLFEAILGSKGVYFYRPEFALKLRNLCDKYKIPIFADEILTGGGRTGKFFAFEHYEGFEPDFVSFGKGLQISGIGRYSRENGLGISYNTGPVTNRGQVDALLKGWAVLKRIHEGNLIENARETGAYMLQKLQESAGTTDPEKLRGMGLLIADKIYEGEKKMDLNYVFERIMPPLTLSKKDVDDLIIKKKK
ncbi:MAG: aminotransferase class III-fold pyridoxal phosphate-dependent enzyme [Bacteriovoracaceae bacterium]